MSIIPIPLLFPRVAMIVVSRRFPKARFILFSKINPSHPFGTLPKIQMRHNHSCWTTMFGCERLIVIFQSDEGLTIDDIGERHVCGVPTVATSRDKHRLAVEFRVLK